MHIFTCHCSLSDQCDSHISRVRVRLVISLCLVVLSIFLFHCSCLYSVGMCYRTNCGYQGCMDKCYSWLWCWSCIWCKEWSYGFDHFVLITYSLPACRVWVLQLLVLLLICLCFNEVFVGNMS